MPRTAFAPLTFNDQTGMAQVIPVWDEIIGRNLEVDYTLDLTVYGKSVILDINGSNLYITAIEFSDGERYELSEGEQSYTKVPTGTDITLNVSKLKKCLDKGENKYKWVHQDSQYPVPQIAFFVSEAARFTTIRAALGPVITDGDSLSWNTYRTKLTSSHWDPANNAAVVLP